jgi:hypothetical protein
MPTLNYDAHAARRQRLGHRADHTQFITRFNWEQGAAFGFLLLVLSTAIVWIGLAVSGQRLGDVMRRA